MAQLAVAIDDVEVDIRAAVPAAHYLFIEPDVRRAVANAEPAADPAYDD